MRRQCTIKATGDRDPPIQVQGTAGGIHDNSGCGCAALLLMYCESLPVRSRRVPNLLVLWPKHGNARQRCFSSGVLPVRHVQTTLGVASLHSCVCRSNNGLVQTKSPLSAEVRRVCQQYHPAAQAEGDAFFCRYTHIYMPHCVYLRIPLLIQTMPYSPV